MKKKSRSLSKGRKKTKKKKVEGIFVVADSVTSLAEKLGMSVSALKAKLKTANSDHGSVFTKEWDPEHERSRASDG